MYEEAKKRLGRYNLSADEKNFLKKLVTKKPLDQIKKDNEEFSKKVTIDFREKLGVTCFSGNSIEKKENLLMWSHYANNHKGLCLVFDTTLRWGKRLEKVIYWDEYPKFNYFDIKARERIEYFNKVYTSKSDIWRYENEYRILGSINPSIERILPFEQESLIEVICGCEMKVEQREEVIEILKKRRSPVKLYQAVKKEREFGLKKQFIDTYGG